MSDANMQYLTFIEQRKVYCDPVLSERPLSDSASNGQVALKCIKDGIRISLLTTHSHLPPITGHFPPNS